ncbi:DUF1801 domain-containing protein [Ruania halotolerans]|uniref:DUF1801 domain-containing protein n=1 Tax=Ruania halotolerans TaxID=2897773 RepID=UPI001E37B2F2|nr:DUF1801 domain-containing protein [Ruania halotolerans]UFU05588.1 DUF1801 domain-containing protein [Ruania halotolerans]
MNVEEYIDHVTPATRQRDARTLLELMQRVTGQQPELHGTIIGFGSYHYRYESGREGDAAAAGFAPRKGATTIYLMDGVEKYADELAALGPHRTGVGCLYLTDLDAIDLTILESIIGRSYALLTSGVYGSRAHEGTND